MRIRDMMHDNLAIVGPEKTFTDLLRSYRTTASRLVYVVDEAGTLIGVVSSYDILRAMLPFYLDSNLIKALPDDDALIRQAFSSCQGQPVSEIMTKEFVSLSPDDSFLEAEALIAERGVNVLPVLDAEGRLLGEVTRRTILNYLADLCGLTHEG